jgi:hypothetical protein
MLTPETVLQNRYRIIRLLGQGGSQVMIAPDGTRVVTMPDGTRRVFRPGERIFAKGLR